MRNGIALIKLMFRIAKRIIGIPEPPPPYWHVLEPYWCSVDLGASPAVFLRQLDELPEIPRTLFAAHWAVSEVKNGALPQFYFNHAGNLAPEAAVALRVIGFPDAAGAIEATMAEFGLPYPRDGDSRCELACRAFSPETEEDQQFQERMLAQTDVFLDSLGPECRLWDQRALMYSSGDGS